jgi:hypothetical protein
MLSEGFHTLPEPRKPFRPGTVTREVMSTIPFRPRTEQSVERLLRQISVLVAERQELRTHPAGADALEQNRMEIARCQRELNHALIQLYGNQAA